MWAMFHYRRGLEIRPGLSKHRAQRLSGFTEVQEARNTAAFRLSITSNAQMAVAYWQASWHSAWPEKAIVWAAWQQDQNSLWIPWHHVNRYQSAFSYLAKNDPIRSTWELLPDNTERRPRLVWQSRSWGCLHCVNSARRGRAATDRAGSPDGCATALSEPQFTQSKYQNCQSHIKHCVIQLQIAH